jgi:hypothetical protein
VRYLLDPFGKDQGGSRSAIQGGVGKIAKCRRGGEGTKVGARGQNQSVEVI